MSSGGEAGIAIVGLAGRFPGAADVDELWRGLLGGVEGVERLDREALVRAGTTASALADPALVGAGGFLDGIEAFDAERFGINAREASLIDPQHRILLECALEALEHAGYAGEVDGRPVGVYVGAGMNLYLIQRIVARPDLIEAVGEYAVLLGNDKDFLASRVSYKLGLTGPSLTIQTACSTSLVCVATACQALTDYQCDVALAGGVSIGALARTGYRYREGGILAHDGRCRPFDAASGGTVPASGVGLVVLKRLEDARRDRDTIHAVLRGWAINNDGAAKVGYTAPSVEGQARAISLALDLAEIEPGSIGFVETHGTGTQLGDPIEIAALARVFGAPGSRACVLGAIKSNLGHLDVAAGVAGLIKATLVVREGQIPPTLHFTRANPRLGLEQTPFRINTTTERWDDATRRAGVSSFGIGGTNAHVVLEQAPPEPVGRARREGVLLLLSARSRGALERLAARHIERLEATPAIDLRDVGYTTQVGRVAHRHRAFVVGRDAAGVRAALASGTHLQPRDTSESGRSVAFLFPGQGAQFRGMAAELVRDEPVFRASLEETLGHLGRPLGDELRELLLTPGDEAPLRATRVAQPALFAVELALARLWRSLGIEPVAMIGHSVGEYVAACLAGVFTPEDAARVVAARGRLMQACPPGAMLSVRASLSQLTPWLDPALEIAAENAPGLQVVAGPADGIARLEERLGVEGVRCRRLQTSHAFHCRLVDGATAELGEVLARVRLAPPTLPYVSNLSGDWIRPEQAISPAYWVEHLRRGVRFSAGLVRIAGSRPVLLEVGPGRSLGAIAGAHEGIEPGDVVASLPMPPEPRDLALLAACGGLWQAGAAPDWVALHDGDQRRRVPVPATPLDRRRHWIDRAGVTAEAEPPGVSPGEGLAPEARVGVIWRELLALDEVGLDDDFFALGGHSLLAVQLRSRLEAAFGCRVTFDALFAATTVRAQAALCGDAAGTRAPTRIERVSREGRLPLSLAQERLWFIEQLSPGNPAFHVPQAVALHGTLDVRALEDALNDLVARHECLNATFHIDGEGPSQMIGRAERFALPFVDLAGATEGMGSLAEALREEVRKPFDLGRAPLLRARLYRLGPEEHVLALTLHHIVSDGWSMVLIERDLAALYAARVQGGRAELPELPIGYADFAAWQRQELDGEAIAAQLAAWRETLRGYPGVLELPADRPRPPVFGYRGGRRYLSWPRAVVDPVAALARERGATTFMALLAAYATLMGRFAGQGDVVIGSPMAGRTRREAEDLVGFFVNTIPFRIDLTDQPSFIDLIDRARKTATQAFANADVPFHAIVEAAGVSRDLSRPPLIQALFVLETMVAKMAPVAGLLMEEHEIDGGAAQVDLSLHLEEHPDAYVGWWEYNAEIFDVETIDGLDARLRTLLAGLVASPRAAVDTIALLAGAERDAAWRRGGAAHEVLPPAGSLAAAFAAAATRAPGAHALTQAGRTLTYAELDAAAERVASVLARHGAARGRRVLVLAERTLESAIAILGVVKTGAAYVPLTPAYPDERLRFVADDCAPVVGLAPRALASRLDGLGLATVVVEDAVLAAPGPRAPVEVAPEDVAYVIYTSGTTGRPKGAEVSHHAVLRLFAATQPTYRFGPDDVWVLLHALSFDFSVWEMWGAWIHGGRLVAAEDEVRDPAALWRLLEAERVTVLNQTPSAFRALIESPDARRGSLRWVIFGGEALEPAALAPWFEGPGRGGPRLVNMYGITETTVHVTQREVLPGDARPGAASAIGQPLPDLELHVLDGSLEPIPVGWVGELHVGGPGLAHGYLGRPDLTAARFIPHPRCDRPGERLYRTGDLARVRRDGDLEYRGRLDAQVKIRGFRIELGEIEAALLRHGSVADARVLAPTIDGETRLVAYVVAREGATLETALLREHLRALVPDYMVPWRFLALPHIPLTSNGKLDRAALPSPTQDVHDAAPAPHAWTGTDRIVADTIADLLGGATLGPDDDFFEHGGHSLMAVRLLHRLREQSGASIALADFFDEPTIRGLARRLDARPGEVTTPGPIARPRGGALPLSEAQREIFAFEELRPGTASFHVPIGVRLHGRFVPDALARALDAVVARHEVLRSRFALFDGEPGQLPSPARAIAVRTLDLTALADQPRADALARALAAEIAAPLAFAGGELLRALVVGLAPEEHALLITIHHLAFDGWSIGILVRDLALAYVAACEERAIELAPPRLQYADFAAWERERGVAVEDVRFWQARLAGAANLPALATDRPREGETSLEVGTQAVSLPAPLWGELARLGRSAGATPYAVLAALYALVLRARFGVTDVVLGSPVAERPSRDLEDTVGCFLNTVLLRLDVGASVSFLDLVGRARAEGLAALTHARVPFGRLRRELFEGRAAPPYHSWFVLQNVPFESIALPSVTLTPLELALPELKFELALDLTEEAGGVVGRIDHRAALFAPSTIARVARTFEGLAAAVAAAPDRPLTELLGELERAERAERDRRGARSLRRAAAPATGRASDGDGGKR